MIIGTSWNQGESTQENEQSTQETVKSTQENSLSTQETTAERIIEEIRKHPFTTREQLATEGLSSWRAFLWSLRRW